MPSSPKLYSEAESSQIDSERFGSSAFKTQSTLGLAKQIKHLPRNLHESMGVWQGVAIDSLKYR
jgi:hypothetical protein